MVDLVCDKVNEQIAKIAEKKANKTSKEKMFACKLPTETGEYTCSFKYEFKQAHFMGHIRPKYYETYYI